MADSYIPGHAPSKHNTHLSGHWFEFGIHPGTDLVDVSSDDGDVLTRVPRPLAQAIIQLRRKFIDDLAELISGYP